MLTWCLTPNVIRQFSECLLHLCALQVLQAELESEKEAAVQQRMAAHADLTNLKAKLATQDSEVASMRNELDLAAREAQELNTKQVELVSQVWC